MRPLGRSQGRSAGSLPAALSLAFAALLVSPLIASAQRPERPAPVGKPDVAPDGPRALGAPSDLPEFVPGEVIVGYAPRADRDDRVAARRATRTTAEEALEVPRAQLLEIRGDRSPRQAARELERQPDVAYAQPNYYREASEIPDDPRFDSLWGLRNTGQLVRREAGIAGADISALDAWETTTGSGDVTVAVVDTGVDATHPDLADNVTGGGWDFVDDDDEPSDPNGHGTHVAGTIGAIGDNGIGVAGVAWEVGLMPVRVLDANGIGTDQRIADGFAHAAANGAGIVNASLGGEDPAPVMDAAIAAAPGTLFVVAADNKAKDNDATPNYPCSTDEPNVICVAATDQSDELAGFSNYGATAVDLAAPGVDVESTAADGVDRELFFDGFEDALGEPWATTGSWDRVEAPGPASSGEWSLADSPAGDYLRDTDTWADSPAFSLADASDCELRFRALVDVHPSDILLVEGSADGFETEPPFWRPVPSTESWTADLSTLDGESQVQVSFRLISNPDGDVGAGAAIDDVSVRCVVEGPGYDFRSGTSMATPQVAGVAALVLSELPDATATELREAIVDNVDPVGALDGLVASGSRLNAAAALESVLPPRARITAGPEGPTTDNRPVFRFQSVSPATFRCRVDGAPFADCENGHQTDELADGSHTFSVKAVNEHGSGPIASRRFTVDTIAPKAGIPKRPRRSSRRRIARFAFKANEDPISFRCKLDSRRWRGCKSPRRYRVKPGRHIFRVQATDQAGNRGERKIWRFRVRR